jgi:hypothetical protein
VYDKKDLFLSEDGGWVGDVGVGQLLVAVLQTVQYIKIIVFVVMKSFKMPNFTNVEYGTRVRCGECNADTVPGTVSRQGCT